LQHFYLQDMKKAQFYKMKAFKGDVEKANSHCKKQAHVKRLQYKRRISGQNNKFTLKRQRQNDRIVRTDTSKLV